jgi:hypothetical protein
MSISIASRDDDPIVILSSGKQLFLGPDSAMVCSRSHKDRNAGRKKIKKR